MLRRYQDAKASEFDMLHAVRFLNDKICDG